MDKFIGTWKLENNENFVDYLNRLGAPALVSKFVNRQPVKVYIRQEGDEYIIESVTAAIKITTNFKLDETFEEPIMGESTAKNKSLIRLENGVLHYRQRGKKPREKKEQESNSTWSVDGDRLNVVS
ncbi:unnamed protein product [Dibothriocephalus latus]|uniref:Lipocalin/cytosolic fatty-acid binding domain-containing protein n=1 Tax=Dibothriocephalus latus TaxID=60516 RepID=A0A3P7LE55_DIBLA|nr:unnamed protein product [Dibothriocephalus latus]